MNSLEYTIVKNKNKKTKKIKNKKQNKNKKNFLLILLSHFNIIIYQEYINNK
jgi:hypothetical protein